MSEFRHLLKGQIEKVKGDKHVESPITDEMRERWAKSNAERKAFLEEQETLKVYAKQRERSEAWGSLDVGKLIRVQRLIRQLPMETVQVLQETDVRPNLKVVLDGGLLGKIEDRLGLGSRLWADYRGYQHEYISHSTYHGKDGLYTDHTASSRAISGRGLHRSGKEYELQTVKDVRGAAIFHMGVLASPMYMDIGEGPILAAQDLKRPSMEFVDKIIEDMNTGHEPYDVFEQEYEQAQQHYKDFVSKLIT